MSVVTNPNSISIVLFILECLYIYFIIIHKPFKKSYILYITVIMEMILALVILDVIIF